LGGISFYLKLPYLYKLKKDPILLKPYHLLINI
jgi:hypothetical protein